MAVNIIEIDKKHYLIDAFYRYKQEDFLALLMGYCLTHYQKKHNKPFETLLALSNWRDSFGEITSKPFSQRSCVNGKYYNLLFADNDGVSHFYILYLPGL